MEAIKCPNCGSEKVKELTEEKYVCLACDNVFLVHNLSKEFHKTDAHISEIHKDLKEDLGRLMQGNIVDESALLAKAEEHLRMEDWDTAAQIYDKVTEEYPQHAAGWYGSYKALTGNFAAEGRYALFVCGGNYVNEDDEQAGEEANFVGNGYIKRALSCDDADKADIIKNVTAFIRKCAEYGKKDIEADIQQITDGFMEMNEGLVSKRMAARSEKNKDKIKAFIPAIIVSFLLAVCVWYFFASQDWLGKVIGVAASVLVLKFGGKHIIGSFRKAKLESEEWDSVLSESTSSLIEDMNTHVRALMVYCADLDNYNKVLDSLKDENQFIQQYVNNDIDLKDYSELSNNDEERFIHALLSGKIERYNYLLSDLAK